MSQALRTASDRTDEILDRITGTFARKGFDGSSMQDLAAAAGMSVGNFYRYYPSKFALIAALVERCVGEIKAGFDALRSAHDPLEALRVFLHESLLDMDDDEAALWVQINAAALTYPEIARAKRAMDATLREDILAILRSARADKGLGSMPLEDAADFLIFSSAGFFQQRAYEGREAFAGRLQRLTTRLFDAVKSEILADASSILPQEAS